MSHEHPERGRPGEPRDPDPRDEAPHTRDDEAERGDAEEPTRDGLPGITTGDEPDLSS